MTTTTTDGAGEPVLPAGPVHVGRGLSHRALAFLTGTTGLVLVFLVLQAVAALSFRAVALDWPNGRLNWDGAHFARLAAQGYPDLDLGEDSTSLPSYAFYPLYPLLIRGLGSVTGLSTGVVAPLLSLTAATAAVAVGDRWIRGLMGPAGAVALFVGLVVSPALPVLQMGYTEGVALLLLVVALRALATERWVIYAVAVALMSVTRPLAAPLAAVALVHVLLALRGGTRGRGLVAPITAFLLTGVSAAVWPALAGAASGRPTVYVEAMATFRQDAQLPTVWAAAIAYPEFGCIVLAVLVICAWIGLRLMPKEVPVVLRTWVVVYPVYLTVAAVPSSSPLRYLLLEFPIALVLTPCMRRAGPRVALLLTAVIVSVLMSSWWIHTFVPSTIDGSIP